MTPPYLITSVIPEDHGWDPSTTQLAEELYTGADSDRDELAALALLFRGPTNVWTGNAFRQHTVVRCCSRIVDWYAVHSSAESGRLSEDRRHRALLLLACSLASTACAVRLAARLDELPPQLRDAFAAAVAYRAGW